MRFVIPLLFGILGCAVLIGLGVWQLQRLEWKNSLIAEIAGRVAADPEPLTALQGLDPEDDRFRPVTLSGEITGAPLRVLGAWRGGGSGYRIVVPFAAEAGPLLIDLGVVPLDAGEVALPAGRVAVTGNLDWPDDANSGTPEPDGTTWFARDPAAMADLLGTAPVMVVARATDPALAPTPVPVGIEGIRNSHLGYAIQWFGLALVWAGMTAFFLWRIRRRTT